MTDPLDSNSLDQQRRRIRRGRNVVLGLILAGFVILVYAISIAKMG
jgi:hypothetical protein